MGAHKRDGSYSFGSDAAWCWCRKVWWTIGLLQPVKAGSVARFLGVKHSRVWNSIADMDHFGFLVAMDDNNYLTRFGIRQ